MNSKSDLHIVIDGALTEIRGAGGIIASSASFHNSPGLISAFSNVIAEAGVLMRSGSGSSHSGNQWLVYTRKIGEKEYRLVVRLQGSFTAFPEYNRFYDRKEFYFYETSTSFKASDIIGSLPPMQQFAADLQGRLEQPEITSILWPLDKGVFRQLVVSLVTGLQKSIGMAGVDSETASRHLLGAMANLPTVYEKYAGFIINFSADPSILQNVAVHVYTSSQTISNAPEEITVNSVKEGLISQICNGELTYTDEELNFIKAPTGKIKIAEMVRCHLLHLATDYPEMWFPNENLHGWFQNEAMRYFKQYVITETENNEYIVIRATALFRTLINNFLLANDSLLLLYEQITQVWRKTLFTYSNLKCLIDICTADSFEQLNARYTGFDKISLKERNLTLLDEIKIQYCKSALKFDLKEAELVTLFRNELLSKKIDEVSNPFLNLEVNPEVLSNSAQIFELLKKHGNELSSSGVSEFLKKLTLEELLVLREGGSITSPIIDNAISHRIVTKINEILDNGDSSVYQKLADSLVPRIQKGLFSKDSIFEMFKCFFEGRYLVDPAFLKISFSLAASSGFSIYLDKPKLTDVISISDYLQLISTGLNQVQNKDILQEIIVDFETLFSAQKPKISAILDWVTQYPELALKHIDYIQNLLEDMFHFHLADCDINTSLLLNRALIQPDFKFLMPGTKLNNLVSSAEISNKDILRQIYKLGYLSTENAAPGYFCDIADSIIDKHVSRNGRSKGFFSIMKNNIYLVNKKLLYLSIALILILLGSVAGNTYQYLNNRRLYREIDSISVRSAKDTMTYNTSEEDVLRNDMGKAQAPQLLTPKPSGYISSDDIKGLRIKDLKGESVEKLVSELFKNENKKIKAPYYGQKQAYVDELKKLNPGCFGNDTFNGQEIEKIPVFIK